MIKNTSNLASLVAAGIATIFMANIASAQPMPGHHTGQSPAQVAPTIGSITGGGTSGAEMDHRTMGALSPSAVDRTGPTTGEGTSDATMDHSRMGMIQGPGVAAQVGPTSGGGTNDADISHGPNVGPPRR
jgi:hypothetical protein